MSYTLHSQTDSTHNIARLLHLHERSVKGLLTDILTIPIDIAGSDIYFIK